MVRQNTTLENNGFWSLASSSFDAAKDSDALVIITEWDEFKTLDWNYISTLMRSPAWIFDTRCILIGEEIKKTNLYLWQLGS